MQGSLAIKSGVLYVGQHGKTARVASYDLDGHALETDFTFRDEFAGRSEVAGLAVDDDHRIWVADRAARIVRAFTLFGREVVTLGEGARDDDRRGSFGAPVDVTTDGSDDDLHVVVASGGARRHALQVFHVASGTVNSLRPLGDPDGMFRGVMGIGHVDETLYACETHAGRIQVFRRGDFHFDFRVVPRPGVPFRPTAIAPLEGGRAVVATGGEASALLVVDAAGRLERVLAEGGAEDGSVQDPNDVAVEPGADERHTRIAAIDRDGERVQVFTLAGLCYGSFTRLA